MKRTILYPRPLFIFLGALGVFSCSIEPDPDKLPIIQPVIGFPIYQESITLNDVDILSGDSTISKESIGNGDSLYVFNKTISIEKQEVGDKLSIDDIHEHFSQTVDDVVIEDNEVEEMIGFDPVGIDPIEKIIPSEVGIISLDNIEPQTTDPYLFSSIYPGVVDLPDGTHDIPGFDLEPVTNEFSFDDFSEADFESGILTITIVNGLVISLGDLVVGLKTAFGDDIAGASTTVNGPIDPGTSGSGALDLTGVDLPGDIIVEVTGTSPGGSGILIDDDARSSSFSVEISGSDLEVISATAKIPEQTISEMGTIELEPDSNKVLEATILEGSMVIEVDNFMAVSSMLYLSVPSIQTPDGAEFQTSISITGNTIDIQDQTDISGYSLVMSSVDDQSVNYEYDVLTVDTGDELVTIAAEDSIIVSIRVQGPDTGEDLTFSYFEGMVAPQDLGFDGSMEIESDSEILEADLSGGSLVISVNNPVNTLEGGAPEAGIIVSQILDTNDQPLQINTGPMVGEMGPQSIDLSGYRILLPRDDQNLYYTADVTTAYEIGSYSLMDSVQVDILVTGLVFNTVRGYFSQDAMVDSSAIELDDSTRVQSAVLNTGILSLSIVNNIGVEAGVFFQINEFLKNGSMLDTSFSIAEGATDIMLDLAGYSLVVPTDVDTQRVNYVSSISLPEDVEMTLSLSDSIAIDVSLTGIAFSSITGAISPVTVDIDTVEQTIDALPEELNGFDFETVEMVLDFSSSIDLPIYLNLKVVAYNDENSDSVVREISQNIHSDPHIDIENAEELINILPDRIIATGSAQVGHLDSMGTVASDDSLSGLMSIRAPLAFIIDPDAVISPDPSELDSLDLTEGGILGLSLMLSLDNQWSFGAELDVLVAPDSVDLVLGNVDTLISDLRFEAGTKSTVTLDLDQETFELLKRSPNWIQPELRVLAGQDGQGDPQPIRFLSTDTLTIRLDGLSVSIDLSELGE